MFRDRETRQVLFYASKVLVKTLSFSVRPVSPNYYSFDPDLGEGLCIFTSFHFPDSGLYQSNGFDFYFDLF